jgi:hypothetical protein
MGNITKALLRTPSPPCLLRAPTGSGKTFVMGQVLQRVGCSLPQSVAATGDIHLHLHFTRHFLANDRKRDQPF